METSHSETCRIIKHQFTTLTLVHGVRTHKTLYVLLTIGTYAPVAMSDVETINLKKVQL